MPENRVSGTTGVEGESRPEERGKPLRWSVHPARERGWRLALAVAAIPLMGGAVHFSTGSSSWALFAGALLLLSLLRFFFPTVYTLTPTRIEARYPIGVARRPWTDFLSYHVEDRGIFLSPYTHRNRKENLRGMFILTGEFHEEASRYVRERIPQRKP